MKVLWTCMIHEGDTKNLHNYCESIKNLNTQPSEVCFIISGVSEECKNIINKFNYKYLERNDNSGFNESFNIAYRYAVENSIDWMITMTVRCRPQKDWLCTIKLDSLPNNIGMVTTLTLKNHDEVFNLGHCLSETHGCFDCGFGIESKKVNELKNEWIYCPCSGAAAYKILALNPEPSFGKDSLPLNGSLFKSYNCDALGYLVKSNGYLNKIVKSAISTKIGISGSTSSNPNSIGLNANQELSRLLNIRTYRKNYQYLINEYNIELCKRDYKIEDIVHQYKNIDSKILTHLSKNYSRKFDPKNEIEEELSNHCGLFVQYKNWWKKIKAINK